jgi:hypothetical protein
VTVQLRTTGRRKELEDELLTGSGVYGMLFLGAHLALDLRWFPMPSEWALFLDGVESALIESVGIKPSPPAS